MGANYDYEDEAMQRYSFKYVDCDGKTYEQAIITPGITWMECLDDYVKFLEGIFKYKIQDQIKLKKSPYHNMRSKDYPDPWTGEYVENEDPNHS